MSPTRVNTISLCLVCVDVKIRQCCWQSCFELKHPNLLALLTLISLRWIFTSDLNRLTFRLKLYSKSIFKEKRLYNKIDLIVYRICNANFCISLNLSKNTPQIKKEKTKSRYVSFAGKECKIL